MFRIDELKKAKDYYDKNGVVIINDLLDSSLVEEAIIEAQRIFEKANSDIIRDNEFWRLQNDKLYFEKFEPVIKKSGVFEKLIFNQDVLSIVGLLLNDSKMPFLFKDKLIFKAPGQDGYPLHQDFNWWHDYQPDDVCTVVIPLDPISDRNGGIEFYLGCHRECYLPEGQNRALNEEEEPRLDDYESVIYNMNPGDILIFHSLTPHFSSRNMSKIWRRQLYPTYCSSRIGNVYEKQIATLRMREKARHGNNIYSSST